MARYTRSNVDVILDKASKEKKELFAQMCLNNHTLVDLQKYLYDVVVQENIDIDFPIPCVSAIAIWRQKQRKISRQIETFNALNTEFDGINGLDLVSRMTYEIAQYIFKAMEILNNDLENTPPQSLLKQLPTLLRECRALMDLKKDYNEYRSFENEVYTGYVLALEHIEAMMMNIEPKWDSTLKSSCDNLKASFLEQLRAGNLEALKPNFKADQTDLEKIGYKI